MQIFKGVLSSILFVSTILSASSGSVSPLTISDKYSLVLSKKSLEIKASYLKVNDRLDIFHLKEKQFDKFGSIGDMDGYSLEVRYGLTKRDSLFISTQKWNIDYVDSVLENKKYRLFNRYQLIKSPHKFFSSLSFDVGVEQNSAGTIVVSSDHFLNGLIKKIKPNSDIKIDDGNIISDDTTFTFYDKEGKKIYPHINIGSLKSNTYFARVFIGKEFSKSSILDIYFGYRYSEIKTSLSFLPNNSLIKNMTKDYEIPNLNREETDLELGISYLLRLGRFSGECSYEFHKINRDSDVSYLDYSHIIDASLSMNITKKSLLYVGGKLMLEQFNSDIPYLYNRYTKTQFDHKYGFAKFGFLHRF